MSEDVKAIDVENFHIEINATTQRGWFEHGEEEIEGGLWFMDGVLVDYDGVFELPAAIVHGIHQLGFRVECEDI
ncbi:hypothetical protein [Acinetobacter baumannii]